MYIIIRIIAGIIIFIGLWLLIKRSKIKNKRLLLISCFISILILTSLSALCPIENLVISFSNPEKVFHYLHSGEITGTINGNSSSMILYRSNDDNSWAIIPKGKNGWKIGTYFSYKEIFNKTIERRVVKVYNVKNTEDYYVIIWDPLATDVVDITDNKGAEFTHNMMANEVLSTKNVMYYTYVKNIRDGYALIIDGNEIILY